MSDELEAAGALATAGLAAGAIEGRAGGDPHSGEVHRACLNCGARIDGAYCSTCGQPAHVHRTIGHMVEEIIHGVAHLDTRAWRTLPKLIFRPGTLTHDYIHGKRTRYISPLALFLFIVFAMYFAFSLTGGPRLGVNDAGPSTIPIEGIGSERDAVRDMLAAEGSDTGRPMSREVIYELISQAARAGEIDINTGNKTLDKKIQEKLENPELAVYKLQNAAYKFSFMLVPISLPFMWLVFFWKRGLTLFDHCVFVLYSLSFVSLLFLTVALLELVEGPLGRFDPPGWFVLIPPAHMFFQLKGAYTLGWLSAAWRTLALSVFAIASLVIFLLALVAIGFVA
ncbi:DUF3667 domain-containing protein [bacterium]|nr:DUF3667 domain-containing protein [bacterium]